MAKKRELEAAALFSVLVIISGCATQKPVLSSNEHLLRVGPEVAQQDIDHCMERAKATSTEGGTDSSQNTVAGAATNSVAGAPPRAVPVVRSWDRRRKVPQQAPSAGLSVASLRRSFTDCFGLNRPGHPIGNW
jgi:hypothetical protein